MRRNLNLLARNFYEIRCQKNDVFSRLKCTAWDTEINRFQNPPHLSSLSDEAKEEQNDSRSDKAKDNAKKQQTEISNYVVYSDLKGRSYKYHA